MEQVVNAIRDNIISFVFSIIMLTLVGVSTWTLTTLLGVREDVILVKKELAMQSTYSAKMDGMNNELTTLRLQQIATTASANATMINEINKRMAQCEARLK